MFDLSFLEVIIVLIIGVFFLKPQDIPKILNFIKQAISYFSDAKKELYSQLSNIKDESLDNIENVIDVDKVNHYLEKIISIEGRYNGPYDLKSVKKYYNHLLNRKN